MLAVYVSIHLCIDTAYIHTQLVYGNDHNSVSVHLYSTFLKSGGCLL